MDLMYGCGADYDLQLQDILDCDLKSEMDRIMAAAGSNADLMTELANGPLLSEEGFDEFAIQFDTHEHLLLDPYGLSIHGLGPLSKATSSPLRIATVPGGMSNHGHTNSWTSSASVNGFPFDEQYGVMVDPSSIVPVSVGSVGSSASGSETDPECTATDDDEDETEVMNAIQEGWIVPEHGTSRSPSPAVVPPEFEFIEEPEFILSEPVPEGPPPKKRKQKHEPQPHTDGKIYPKPGFSYSCLIAMALKNSKNGSLPVSEIYKFMCDHFPYFKTAPSGWKNSVRHNLSLNKCFEKIEKPGNGARKGCLWALNPGKIHKMDEEVQKWLKKDPNSIIRAMSDPENLELVERGELKRDYSGNGGASDEDEEEEFSEVSTSLTPAQLQARGGRQGSTDSVGERTMTTTPVTMSQIRATLQKQHVRPLDKSQSSSDDFGTITTNVQGNYLCHPNGTFTLSFSGLNNSTTPLIIRRTPVK